MSETLLKGYHFCKVYKGLQLHFDTKTKYSYKLYGPLNRYSLEKFESSKEKFIFINLSNRFTEEEFIHYICFTAFKFGKVPYIRSISNESLIIEFLEGFMQDKINIRELFNIYIEEYDLDELKTNGIDYPEIFKKCFVQRELHIDIFSIFDIILKLSERYTDKFRDDIFFSEKMNIYLEYRKLLDFSSDDLQYFKALIKTKLEK